MGSSKVTSLLLVYILFISTASPILGCPYCGVPSPAPMPKVKPPSTPQPPVTMPVPGVPVPIPPVTVPPVVPVPIPPVTVPPVVPVPIPPVTVPPITPPVLPLPPVLPVPLPPVPIVNPPTTPGPSGKPCPPGPMPEPKCPINVLKLNVCVDILGGLVHGVIGHPLESKCCSVVKGLVDLDAALCLCTILKIKALDLKIYVPIALEVLITCGKHPPPGFTCPF